VGKEGRWKDAGGFTGWSMGRRKGGGVGSFVRGRQRKKDWWNDELKRGASLGMCGVLTKGNQKGKVNLGGGGGWEHYYSWGGKNGVWREGRLSAGGAT